MNANIIKSIALLSVMAACSTSFAGRALLNESPNVKTYDCLETATSTNQYGRVLGSEKISMVQIVDYKDAFYALNTEVDAAAYSGKLNHREPNGYITNKPSNGITMGRGTGDMEGTFLYIGANSLISWDCRR